MHTEHSLVLLPIISYPYCRSARCKPACGGDVWECQGCLNQKWRWRFVFAVVLTNFTSALGLGGPSWASIMKIWQSSLCFWNRCFSTRRGWVIVFWVFRAQKTQNMTDLQLPYTAVNFFGGKSLPLGLLWCQNFCFRVYVPCKLVLDSCLNLCTENPLISLAQRNPFPSWCWDFIWNLSSSTFLKFSNFTGKDVQDFFQFISKLFTTQSMRVQATARGELRSPLSWGSLTGTKRTQIISIIFAKQPCLGKGDIRLPRQQTELALRICH